MRGRVPAAGSSIAILAYISDRSPRILIILITRKKMGKSILKTVDIILKTIHWLEDPVSGLPEDP